MGHARERDDHDRTHNLAVLSGTVTSEPTRRTLRSGVDVVNFDVSTPLGDGTAAAPIAWYEPTASAVSAVEVGDQVVVIGTVRRRFFRVGAQTQSRTEVVVDRLVPARRTKTARSAVAAAAASLTQADE